MACHCPINLTLQWCAVGIVTRVMQNRRINNDSSISNITNRPAFLQFNCAEKGKGKKNTTFLPNAMLWRRLHHFTFPPGRFVIKYHCLNNKWDLGHSLAHLLEQAPQSKSIPAGLNSSLDTLPHVTPDSLFLLLPHFSPLMSTKDMKPNLL